MSQKMAFNKLPMANSELAELLVSRGLAADKEILAHILDAVGYYRFTGYLVPFKLPDSDNYRPGTSLDTIWEIYTFDRHLRLIAADALARIEIAIRALIVKYHTAADKNPFAYTKHAGLPNINEKQHAQLLSHIADAMRKAKDSADILHLERKYGITDFPPVWVMMEHVPMGAVTFYYEGLPVIVQQSLANTFFVRPSIFTGMLMTLKNARNICAHHSRFWNKRTKSRITKRIGRNPELAAFEECLSRQTSFNYTTTFTVLSLCAYCMGIIRPESKWKDRCRKLLRTATPFILRGMGAPADWESLALWKD